MVDCISVEFPGHVSKKDLSALVVELIEHILFMRGQFPFRFDEGRKYVNELKGRADSLTEGSFEIFGESSCPKNEDAVVGEDTEKQQCQKISPQRKKAKEQLVKSMQDFEDYLMKLNSLLCKHEIRELVLNFGKNFLMPKELFHIKLPGKCLCSDYGEKMLPFQWCRRYLFRKVVENQVKCKNFPSEDLFPVSVMLRISNTPITDDMEQKPFYSVPVKRKLFVIELAFRCGHPCSDLTRPVESNDGDIVQNAFKLTLDEELSSNFQSDLWVQLMPVLKGFKDNFTAE